MAFCAPSLSADSVRSSFIVNVISGLHPLAKRLVSFRPKKSPFTAN